MNEVSAAGGGGAGGPGPGPAPRGMMGGPPLRPGMRPMGPMGGPMGPLMGVGMMGGPPGGGPGGGMGGMRPIMGPMGMDPGFVGNMNVMMQVNPCCSSRVSPEHAAGPGGPESTVTCSIGRCLSSLMITYATSRWVPGAHNSYQSSVRS